MDSELTSFLKLGMIWNRKAYSATYCGGEEPTHASGKTIYTHGAITYVFSHVSKSFVELSHRLQENNETTILSQ